MLLYKGQREFSPPTKRLLIFDTTILQELTSMTNIPVILNARDAVVAVLAAAVGLVAAVQALLDAVAHQGERDALATDRCGRARKLLFRIAI